jgi:hypothetical protein
MAAGSGKAAPGVFTLLTSSASRIVKSSNRYQIALQVGRIAEDQEAMT